MSNALFVGSLNRSRFVFARRVPLRQVNVNGHQSDPLFAWLKAASGIPGDIPWNFSKFLVTCGDRVKRYSHEVNYVQFYFNFPIPFITFALLLKLSPFRNSDPGSHRRHSSPLPQYGACLHYYCGTAFSPLVELLL